VAQGVRLINLEEGEQVAAVAKIVEKDDEGGSPAATPAAENPAGNA